jgi:hypothetical protein
MLKAKLGAEGDIERAATSEREMERRVFAELVTGAGVKGKEEGRMGKLLGGLMRRLQPKHGSR